MFYSWLPVPVLQEDIDADALRFNKSFNTFAKRASTVRIETALSKAAWIKSTPNTILFSASLRLSLFYYKECFLRDYRKKYYLFGAPLASTPL